MKEALKKQFSQPLITFFIMILNVPAAASVDLYAPSLPAMMKFFGGPAGLVQATIPLYMLGMAISQWFCGFLSDIKGRRLLFLSTAMIFLLGSVTCMLAHQAWVLLLGRFLQGVGGGTSAMICPSLINEAIEPHRSMKVSSYFGMTYAMTPIFAPLIGGFVQHHIGWQANFGVLFGIMLLCTVAVYFYLPETCQSIGQKRFNLPNLLTSSWQVLCNREYLRAVFSLTALWSLIPVFSLIAPFVVQQQLGQSAAAFGVVAMSVGVGFFIGNLLNTRLQSHISTDVILYGSLSVMLPACGSAIVLAALHIVTLWTVVVPAFIVMTALGSCFSCVYAKAATCHTKNVGLAGALIGCCILAGAVILTAIISSLHVTSAIGLATAMGCCAAAALLILKIL